MSKKVEICCRICEKTFLAYKCDNREFCSRECASVNKVYNSERTKRKCEACGIEFVLLASVARAREKIAPIKYCSKSCWADAYRGRKRNGEPYKSHSCKRCGKEFDSSRKRRVYCSRECQWAARRENNKPGSWYENGYVVVYAGNGEGVKEHILIMEQKIGRALTDDECVHHINGVIDDNRIENLELMTKGGHSSHHRLKEVEDGKPLFGRKS